MSPKFWDYFLSIESDLAACARYVEFSPRNYATYSNEFARIIMAASSEIDAIFRELCVSVLPGSNARNISEYHPIITTQFPTFVDHVVEMERYSQSFAPWVDWSSTKSPDWWGQGYNKIKHDRTNNFEQASLSNALKCVSALLLVILYYHRQVSGKAVSVEVGRITQLFYPRRIKPTVGGGGISWEYSAD